MSSDLPPEIADRINRIYHYHHATKYSFEGTPTLPTPDPTTQPATSRTFPDAPKIALPTSLLDEPAPTLDLLESGTESLPESQRTAAQDLKTLATWLFMAAGVIKKIETAPRAYWQRTNYSSDSLYPCELYVLALAISDLEPALYHYNPREFALRKLRDGSTSLHFILRGRPDLGFLKTVPAVLLVSTIYSRSAWKYPDRAYRHALTDAGHLIQNLETAALGLGIQPLTRLLVNDNTARQLIGIPPDSTFDQLESVQAVVVWADNAASPLSVENRPDDPMTPIPRAALSPAPLANTTIPAIHHACTAPGVAVREIRPPLTELSPIGTGLNPAYMPTVERPPGGLPLRTVLMHTRNTRTFFPHPIPRDHFLLLNRLAFRSGSFFPIRPDGPHVGLVRPFWIIHDVTGVNPGLWYYNPPSDQFFHLREGHYRFESQYLTLNNPAFSDASAVCFLSAHLHTLLTAGLPDSYRLAHLEAGLTAQRLSLAASALDRAAIASIAFYDDEARKLFDLHTSGWEILYAVAVGTPQNEDAPKVDQVEETEWR